MQVHPNMLHARDHCGEARYQTDGDTMLFRGSRSLAACRQYDTPGIIADNQLHPFNLKLWENRSTAPRCAYRRSESIFRFFVASADPDISPVRLPTTARPPNNPTSPVPFA